MPSTVEELSNNRVKLTVEIPSADLKPALDKAYRQIAQQVTIPGFRKGKVPQAIIDQRFGREMVLNEALQEVLPQAYGKALEDHGIVPLGEPTIDVTQLEAGKDVVFTAELDKRPDFDLPNLGDIKVTVDAIKSTDDDVAERLEVLRERFATYTEVERAAEEGDFLTVDFVASQNGEELAEGKAEGAQLKLGAEGNLAGFNEAVKGLKAGETAEFASTLVGGAHAGQEADVKVTVQKVQEQKLPEVDDDFAQLISEFDTVEEMKADLAKGVAQQAAFEQASDARDKVLEEVVKQAGIELPQALVEAEVANRKAAIEQQLAQAGMTLETYLTEVEEGRDADEFWTEVEDRTTTGIKAQLILDKFAEDNDLQLEQMDLMEYLMRRAQQSGTSPEQEMQHMMEHNHMQEWMGEIRRNKALAAIVEQAQVVDAEGNTVDLTILNPKRPVAEPELEADDAGEAELDTEAEAASQEAVKPKRAKKADAESTDSPESADSPDSPDSPASAE